MIKQRSFTLLDENGQSRIIKFQSGTTLIVTGPNGVGKSALLDDVTSGLGVPAEVELFTGHRAISFSNDDVETIGMPIDTLRLQMRTNPQHANRYRNPWGEQHLKSVIRRVQLSQSQSTDDFIKKIWAGVPLDIIEAHCPRIIDQINRIFSSANLAIRLGFDAGYLKAIRGDARFGLERLSDGERAALLITGAILVQPRDNFIIIDEPERHLNPAISGPLLTAVVRARIDLGFVFATHDLKLIEWLKPDIIIHVQDSKVVNIDPEKRQYKFNQLDSNDKIHEKLRSSLLGSRKALLLVEGDSTSDDQSLYSLVYPGWNVVSRGGSETIVNDARSLQNNTDYHWLTVAGIIDSDGRTQDEKDILSKHNVFSLPTPTIENLFFQPEIISAMAEAIHNLTGGPSGVERIETLRRTLGEKIDTARSEIIARRVVWFANRLLSQRKVSVKNIREGQIAIEGIDLIKIEQDLKTELELSLSNHDAIEALSFIPIKNTVIPAEVVKIIGFTSFKFYKQGILKQLESNSVSGIEILTALRNKLPALPSIT